MGRAGGLAEGGGIAGTGVPGGAHCRAWAPLAEERRGPAPGRSGSSCLPLPPLSALAERPDNPSTRLQRHTLLSPGSIGLRVSSSMVDMAHVSRERLENPCSSSAGQYPPDALLLTLREKQDTGEGEADEPQHRPRAPRQPRPCAAISSPHQVALRHGWSPVFHPVRWPHGSLWPLVTSARLGCVCPRYGQGRPRVLPPAPRGGCEVPRWGHEPSAPP